MRVLAIGDIHGCLRAFSVLMNEVGPRPEDLLVTLGDYVDRGPDSRGVLDYLIDLYATGRLVPLRGNHDQMMAEARERNDPLLWLSCGGVPTLQSYGAADPEQPNYEDIPERHWKFLEEDCVDWHETDTHFFVHANAYPDQPLADQPGYMLRWEPLVPEESRPHESGKVMVCGHTRQKKGTIRDLGHAICIDTGAYAPTGWLTCLDVISGRWWQANQAGETRKGRLVPR